MGEENEKESDKKKRRKKKTTSTVSPARVFTEFPTGPFPVRVAFSASIISFPVPANVKSSVETPS